MKNYLNKLFYQNKNINVQKKEDVLSIWESGDIKCFNVENEIPEIIWSYWHDGDFPDSVKICTRSWRDKNPSFQIVFLNKYTIKEYLPNFNFEEYYIDNPVFYCDLIRILLLDKFGGIYLDSSVFLNKSLDEYLLIIENNNLDLLCFSSEGHQNDSGFPITESWFLISRSDNLFLKQWFSILDLAFKKDNSENYFKENFSDAYLSVNKEKRDYFYIYMASQQAMRETNNIKIGFLDSRVNGFFYNYKFKFDYEKIAKYLLLDTSYNEFPSVIKLINKNRVPIDKFIKDKLYRKNSMFGKYLR